MNESAEVINLNITLCKQTPGEGDRERDDSSMTHECLSFVSEHVQSFCVAVCFILQF